MATQRGKGMQMQISPCVHFMGEFQTDWVVLGVSGLNKSLDIWK